MDEILKTYLGTFSLTLYTRFKAKLIHNMFPWSESNHVSQLITNIAGSSEKRKIVCKLLVAHGFCWLYLNTIYQPFFTPLLRMEYLSDLRQRVAQLSGKDILLLLLQELMASKRNCRQCHSDMGNASRSAIDTLTPLHCPSTTLVQKGFFMLCRIVHLLVYHLVQG